MLRWFTNWVVRNREWRAAHDVAWRHATEIGNDSLSTFQRLAIASVETVTGPLKLKSQAFEDLPNETYLTGRIPHTDLTLYLYKDEAQVHGLKRAQFIAEKWDYDNPEALVKALENYLRSLNAANPAFKRTHTGGTDLWVSRALRAPVRAA